MVSPLWVVVLLLSIAVVVVDSFSSSFSSSTTAPSHHHRSSCHRYSGNCCNAIIILYCSRSSSDTSVDGGIIRDNTATAIRFSKLDNSHTNYNASSNASSNSKNGNIRLNKVFKATHSRRAADELICTGRVCINGRRVTAADVGVRVTPYKDVITLDDEIVVGWEGMNYAIAITNDTTTGTMATAADAGASAMLNDEAAEITNDERWTDYHPQQQLEQQQQRRHVLQQSLSTFEYVKYYKPIGITCTTDPLIQDNIIQSIYQAGYMPKHRIYPVGRLDKLTSGLILLTSDGRLVNSVLRCENKYPKVYEVTVDVELTNEHIYQLQAGIIIKTISQRSNNKGRNNANRKPLIARTRPCIVSRIVNDDSSSSSSSSSSSKNKNRSCRMTLMEGRNRQIRKMMGALGLTVINLRRIEFMGIHLQQQQQDTTTTDTSNSTTAIPTSSSLDRPGDWAYLNKDEMKLIEDALWTVTEKGR